MSRLRFIFRSKLRSAGVASIVCVAALALSGCVVARHSPLGVDFLTLTKSTTDPVMLAYFGPACNQDINGNGTRGDTEDRAKCAFFAIRGVCNQQGGDYLKVICYAVTEAKYWPKFVSAANQWRQGGYPCVHASLDGSVSGPVVFWGAETVGGDCTTK